MLRRIAAPPAEAGPLETLGARPAAEIAATVRRPAKLQLTEANLASLRCRRQAAADEIRGLVAARSNGEGRGRSTIERRIDELCTEREALETKISEGRRAVAEPRREHAGAIVEALAGQNAEATRRVVTGLAGVREGLAVMTEAAEAVRRAGGIDLLLAGQLDLPRYTEIMVALTGLEEVARRLAGEAP